MKSLTRILATALAAGLLALVPGRALADPPAAPPSMQPCPCPTASEDKDKTPPARAEPCAHPQQAHDASQEDLVRNPPT